MAYTCISLTLHQWLDVRVAAMADVFLCFFAQNSTFRCLWPGCDKALTTTVGIRRHIRITHLSGWDWQTGSTDAAAQSLLAVENRAGGRMHIFPEFYCLASRGHPTMVTKRLKTTTTTIFHVGVNWQQCPNGQHHILKHQSLKVLQQRCQTQIYSWAKMDSGEVTGQHWYSLGKKIFPQLQQWTMMLS